jgi:hypothetical protein
MEPFFTSIFGSISRRQGLGRQFPNGPVVNAAAAAVDTEDRIPVDKLAVARF